MFYSVPTFNVLEGFALFGFCVKEIWIGALHHMLLKVPRYILIGVTAIVVQLAFLRMWNNPTIQATLFLDRQGS